MKTEVVVSACAVWTPGGVWFNASPPRDPVEGALAPWPDAPPLGTIHQSARRPHRQAVLLVQLAHVLLSTRADATRNAAPAPPRLGTDLLIGTRMGSAEADADFVHGLAARGSGFGSPSTFVYTLPTAAPAEVALALGLRGALATLAAGSISGLFAVATAARHVGQGRSRACIAGGVELTGHRLSGLPHSEGEVVALFLLEAASTPTRWPRLSDVAVGFDPEPPAVGDPSMGSPMATLTALASACVGAEKQASVEVAGRSREGYWARVRTTGSHRA